MLHEIESPTHVRSDVAAAILFYAVEFCIFSTDFHCLLAVLIGVLLLLIRCSVLGTFLYISEGF